VTGASNGDFWRDYPRDIDLARSDGKLGGVRLLAKVCCQLPRWRGYDVVQLINPMFLELKAERIGPIYHYLRRHNRKIILGAFGMDWYWVNECVTRKPLRYSDFNIGKTLRTDEPALRERRDWLGTAKGRLNQLIARECDAIVSGLYEYHVCYAPHFPTKTHFIPFPIRSVSVTPAPVGPKVKVFIGISKGRSVYKGTDIMLRAAEDVLKQFPDRMELLKAEGLPFAEYQRLMDGADVLLDQLYGYTPAMNALLAMSKGIVCVGGGEPEGYALLGEDTLRPLVNVEPSFESVRNKLEQLVLHPDILQDLKMQSVAYISRHHDYIKVARQYEALYIK
jgi:glycosyltransferase involved in cell wall biosynthesis